jgi:hypothetical protein
MSGKIFQEFGADIAGFIPESGIESRLTATGLIGVIVHVHASLLQDFHHIESSLRVKLVYKAWYK